ncbi:substrate-binding periplasmic protein [Chitinimonas lacunae]|uniref:Substrate-binding periplasmic protein n=1 Tax=Chitinimonas lacunae TaxID=1963018 RepID=A0ABV8MR42_9NEIS
MTYPQSGTAGDVRDIYPLKLLQLALDKAGATHYVLRMSSVPMLQGRALVELERGKLIRVGWGMTSIEREAALLPIRIPMFKGMIGWRIPLVRQDRSELLGSVRTLQDLRRFVVGQGHDWPDTEILRGNGIEVVGVPLYDSLFQMLISNRFDYFPRSIVEIWAEAEQYRKDGVVIDQNLLIRYPTTFYFFVNKRDTALAETLRTGLEQAIADGSFDRLFCQHYGQLITQAKLERRTLIELVNPILPPETPLARKELWFRVGLCAGGK